MNSPNSVVVEFTKDGSVVYSHVFRYYNNNIGSVFTDTFTPTEAGEYIVNVGYRNYSISSMEDAIYQGSYRFTVKPGASAIRGDADGDDSVTIFDATAIQRHLAEIEVDGFSEDAADADGDGSLSIFDATAIQRWLASIPGNESIGQPIA